MADPLIGLTQAQIERIARSCKITEQTRRGASQGASAYRPGNGVILQGRLTQACHYDSSKSPQSQFPGKMKIIVDEYEGVVDAMNHNSSWADVDDSIKDILVWPSVIWMDKSFYDEGENVIVAWISGRWRIIGAQDCLQSIPSDDETY